ncbi:MAG: Dam family site-specific DNA-(adenine-N6)-methyltransferase [Bacteroidales bacterium]|nr:Dam family site-specific DNA-(adenine-N6)-methyltransferase [Bacteroidales bacterium]
MLDNKKCSAKPFLKWAGGKAQLINLISSSLPGYLKTSENLVYVEPFIGSGALLFRFLQSYPNTKKAVVNDINPDLFNAYNVIKKEPENLIKKLGSIQDKYFSLKSEMDRKAFFLVQRDKFNARNLNSIQSTTLLIFMNRTCYNGLYRVNSKGEFNVPFGKYSKPKICDTQTILCDSQLLQKVTILNVDYSEVLSHIESPNAFFYIDPPYKPISQSSSFNAYDKYKFDDTEQERLKDFCVRIGTLGHYWLLSNSDVKNFDTENEYFDNLYKDFNIKRVKATRKINSVSSKRGEIFELLISNYKVD